MTIARHTLIYFIYADKSASIEQQSHNAQSDLRKIDPETAAPGSEKDGHPGLYFGAAQVPRCLPPRKMHAVA